MRSLLPWLVVSLSALSGACGSDAPPVGAARPDGGAAGPMADAAPRARASVRATVRYAGAKSGPLGVGVFASNPPMGPPLAFQRVASPIYPAGVTLEGVSPGAAVYVVATIDVDPASPTVPGPEDPTGASLRLDVPAQGGLVPAEVTVADR